MSCVKKKTGAICAITLKVTLVAVLISSLPEIAQAAMPVLNANPFTQAQNALKTLIENAVTLGKWLAMACMVVCFLASLTDRFKKKPASDWRSLWRRFRAWAGLSNCLWGRCDAVGYLRFGDKAAQNIVRRKFAAVLRDLRRGRADDFGAGTDADGHLRGRFPRVLHRIDQQGTTYQQHLAQRVLAFVRNRWL